MGVSYHYTLGPGNEYGIFRISLLHYGYIQDLWLFKCRTDDDFVRKLAND